MTLTLSDRSLKVSERQDSSNLPNDMRKVKHEFRIIRYISEVNLEFDLELDLEGHIIFRVIFLNINHHYDFLTVPKSSLKISERQDISYVSSDM